MSRRTAGSGTFRLGRVAGVDVLARPSLLVMGLLMVALFTPQFEIVGQESPVLSAVAFVVALYVSVFLHECAHLAAARAYGMPVASITLHLLGGETLIEGESRTWAQELWTSVVGPLTSLGLGALAYLVAPHTGDTLHGIVLATAYVNVLVGLLNLVPGLPLDGGHVLRAVLWGATGDERRSSIVAARCGQVVAGLALVSPFLLAVLWGRTVSWYDVALGALVAWFLWTGAVQSLRSARWAGVLDRLVARDLAVAEPAPPGSPTLAADLRGVALLRTIANRPAPVYALVDRGGAAHGSLRAVDVDAAYRRLAP